MEFQVRGGCEPFSGLPNLRFGESWSRRACTDSLGKLDVLCVSLRVCCTLLFDMSHGGGIRSTTMDSRMAQVGISLKGQPSRHA